MKALSLWSLYHVVIDDQNKNIVCNLNWKLYLFDFDGRYRDLNLIFVFDSSTETFLTSDIFIKAATIVNDKYLNKLRCCILCIVLAWSLFCLIQFNVGLQFLQFLFENWFFVFLCFLCFLL